MKTYLYFGILSLSLVIFSCVSDGRSKETREIDLQNSYQKMISSYNQIELDASRIANRQVKLIEIPNVLENICNNTCEADYMECTLGRVFINVNIGGYSDRAAKETPIEIPDCEGDTCDDRRVVPADDIKPCDDTRDACLKQCACKYL